MMRQTSFLKWSHSKVKSSGNKNWIHPAEALQRGHVAYLVKFLGNTEVDQPKGIDVVKEGIRKMKFTEHLKRAEGSKSPKVELTISVDGVAVQEPKSKKILHQYPLHRISYCADDKTDKKFFSFIAKEADLERHNCFVFVSDKLAEEITLTIGQAFDLAYRRFLETSGRDLEMRRQLMILQKRVQELEEENGQLKVMLTEYQNKSNRSKNSLMRRESLENNGEVTMNGTSSLSGSKLPLQPPPPAIQPRLPVKGGSASQSLNLLDMDLTEGRPDVGRKLENLSLTEMEEFNPRASGGVNKNGTTNGSQSGHKSNGSINGNGHSKEDQKDMFGSQPFNPNHGKQERSDPFGMGSFEAKELEQAIGAIDKKLAEMRDGFSRGLSFGNDDFSIEALDPLSPSQKQQ